MIKTQVQIPDRLYREAKRVAAENEIDRPALPVSRSDAGGAVVDGDASTISEGKGVQRDAGRRPPSSYVAYSSVTQPSDADFTFLMYL
jgi:hypothetical protein